MFPAQYFSHICDIYWNFISQTERDMKRKHMELIYRDICFNLSYLSALHTNLVLSASKELHSKGGTCIQIPVNVPYHSLARKLLLYWAMIQESCNYSYFSKNLA